MQLHPSAPFGAPDLSLTLDPCFGIWTTTCKQHTFSRLLRAIPVPPASITACPRCCSFPACATRPYLRVEPACASSLPAHRASLPACLPARADRLAQMSMAVASLPVREPVYASNVLSVGCETPCASLHHAYPSPIAAVSSLREPTCASSLPARRAYLRNEPTCASSLPAPAR